MPSRAPWPALGQGGQEAGADQRRCPHTGGPGHHYRLPCLRQQAGQFPDGLLAPEEHLRVPFGERLGARIRQPVEHLARVGHQRPDRPAQPVQVPLAAHHHDLVGGPLQQRQRLGGGVPGDDQHDPGRPAPCPHPFHEAGQVRRLPCGEDGVHDPHQQPGSGCRQDRVVGRDVAVPPVAPVSGPLVQQPRLHRPVRGLPGSGSRAEHAVGEAAVDRAAITPRRGQPERPPGQLQEGPHVAAAQPQQRAHPLLRERPDPAPRADRTARSGRPARPAGPPAWPAAQPAVRPGRPDAGDASPFQVRAEQGECLIGAEHARLQVVGPEALPQVVRQRLPPRPAPRQQQHPALLRDPLHQRVQHPQVRRPAEDEPFALVHHDDDGPPDPGAQRGQQLQPVAALVGVGHRS